MNLRNKILLFAVLPLLVALCTIALTVRHYANSLAQQEQKVIEDAFLAAKDAELKNYVAIAQLAIAHLYESGKTDEATKAEAREILRKLQYSIDGYFFLYSTAEPGKQLMHSKQKELEGKDMWGSEDCAGKLLIQDLIRVARAGGGFENYVWPKYSIKSQDPKPKRANQDSELDCENSRPKRAYVIELPHWGWMLGTGVYLDDVDSALSEIDAQVSRNINDTMLWIAGIAFMSTVAIFLGLMLNIKERTVLDDKLASAYVELQVLTDKLSLTNEELTALAQEIMTARGKERERIKDELHDGIQQKLFASNMQLEVAMKTLPHVPEKSSQALNSIKKLLDEMRLELRKIVDGIVDPDLDLKAGLAKLALDMSQPTRLIKVTVDGEITNITADSKRVLELFAREALVNIVRHADAHQIEMRLESLPHLIKLEICDDGRGFDLTNNHGGHGLRNMKERLELAGGSLTINSHPGGTCLTGILPIT
jgi:two-component system NarL family sensor kinase